MIRLTATFTGLDVLDLKVRYLREAAKAGLKSGVAEAAGLIEGEAKALVPVKTGALRESIHTETLVDDDYKQEVAVIAGYDASNEYGFEPAYARRIEFGFVGQDSLGRHFHQAAQPYMRPAFDNKRAEALEAIHSGITDQLDGALSAVAARR